MTIVVLHLSDIHVKGKNDLILTKANSIAKCTYPDLHCASAIFIVVSGDIAFSGKREEYAAVKPFFLSVKNLIEAETKSPVNFIFVPGNHDCDFSLSGKPRALTLKAVCDDPSQLDDEIIELGVSVQKEFRSFADELHNQSETRTGDKLWSCHRFTVENKEIVFDAINVAWCSNFKEEPGSLMFPIERYTKLQNEKADLRISVLHHPFNWFKQTSYHPFRKFVRQISNVIISGHEHLGGAGEDIHSDSGHSAYIEGCVLQTTPNSLESSFNLVVFNLDNGAYKSSRFIWGPENQYSKNEVGSWKEFRDLPKKLSNSFEIKSEFEQLIADPGGAFQIKGSPIALHDLYVYPDIQEASAVETRGGKKITSSTIFHDISRIKGAVLLTGEEKAGATSLLYMLFKYYHERGLIPLYLRGIDIKGSTDNDILNCLNRAITEQYGSDYIERFHQKPNLEKVLLLDDFYDGAVKHENHKAKILTTCYSRFSQMLVTANETLDFNGSIRPHAEGKLTDLKEYKLLPFGYARRAQLVRRWMDRISKDGSVTEGELIARCDQAERTLDTVMAKNIVPPLPLYLLTLLQSIESGVQGGFEDSGLSEYYDYLIKSGLGSAGVPKNQWGAMIEYCSHLAWKLHSTEHKELTPEELHEFNAQYSKEQIRVDLGERVTILIRARILAKSGDSIHFRYHYIYYFLKGRHLSRQLNNLDVQSYIKSCCAHLYVRENANTILFLAHHAFKDQMFLKCITDAIDEPFKSVPPITFDGKDTEKVKGFVADLPKLVYSGKPPEKAREEVNKQRDVYDDGSDGLATKKEDLEQDEFSAHLISLLKTVEILGQILKNQIASIPRAQRVDLLKLVMCGPLRAINAFFTIFMNQQSLLQIEISELLAKKKIFNSDDERKKTARRLLAWLLQTSAASLLIKAVVSISSNDLMEDIKTASSSIGTPASKLIALGVKLDGPGRLPKEIESISLELQSDFIATRVLQILVLRRLYMFRTEEADRQWLASKKIVDLGHQQSIEYKTRKTKKIASKK